MAYRFLSIPALATALLLSLPLTAATRNNDDSCDIALLPAATLLLPYFEVAHGTSQSKGTTLFTVTNASPEEQIAHVTLWTDFAYPVLDFNIYLTGYDTQSVNLRDVIILGRLPSTGPDISPVGAFAEENQRLVTSNCAALPSQLDAATVNRIQSAFVIGRAPASGLERACNTIGGTHDAAVGYATIDVVRHCTTRNAEQPGYLTSDILFDNVLLGDYQQVDVTNGTAEGGPLVHIRAIPEGGTAAERRDDPNAYRAPFPRTFYSRLLPAGLPAFDARQPLPSTFAAHWSEYNPALLRTSFKIWREGTTGTNTRCRNYPKNVGHVREVVIFDDEENPEVAQPTVIITPIEIPGWLPATSKISVRDTTVFPLPIGGAAGGWVYMNFDSREPDAFATQNWVITSVSSEGRYGIDSAATALGNGCTPAVVESEVTEREGTTIGPPQNSNPRRY